MSYMTLMLIYENSDQFWFFITLQNLGCLKFAYMSMALKTNGTVFLNFVLLVHSLTLNIRNTDHINV